MVAPGTPTSPRPRARFRTVAAVSAPLVAVATLMLGLRVGAGDAVRAAVVFGAPAGRAAPDGTSRIAWQLLTVVDDRGVRETVAIGGLEAVLRTGDGREARWSGATNEDGIAEMGFALEGLSGDRPPDLELTVRAPGDPEPLVAGRARWEPSPAQRPVAHAPAVRPTKRRGPVDLDVLVEGERLVTGDDSNVWIRATLPEGVAPEQVRLELSPEPGLELGATRGTLCPTTTRASFAPAKMRAVGHVTGVGIKALRGEEVVGEWFGALPVAAGAFHADLPRATEAGRPFEVRIVAPNPRTVAYAEVQDERGRVAAAALAVKGAAGEIPHAMFHVPPLAPGLHWLAVSGEPRGAETRAGAAMAWPFLVGQAPGVSPTLACSVGPYLLEHPAGAFPRWTALDGLPARHAKNRRRHAAGLAIALVSLLAAAVLEALLLTASAREAKAVMAEAARVAEDVEPGASVVLTSRTPGGSLAVALLLAVLGFALLAALIVAKG